MTASGHYVDAWESLAEIQDMMGYNKSFISRVMGTKELAYGYRWSSSTADVGKPVSQYTKDGELVKVWTSAKDIERETGFARPNIVACCNGRRPSAYGFIWKR